MTPRITQVLRSLFGEDLPIDEGFHQNQCRAWDSVRHVDLVFALEAEFGVVFDADEVGELTSLKGIRKVLEAKLG